LKSLVIDTSVAVKWFLPEIHFEAASKVLKSRLELLAPDIIWAEFGNTLLKKVRIDEISVQEASDILKDFIRFPLQTFGSKFMLNAAWHMAHAARNNVYDHLYLAMAVNRDCELVTADRRFYDSMNKKPHSSRVIWVEDFR
jgi:predicted nucleic acid-binding protein